MTVTLSIPTVTYAVKAKKALERIGVRSKLIKTVSSDGGCLYAVEIEEKNLYEAAYELKRLEIPYMSVKI